MGISMIAVWLILFFVFLILELITAGSLVSIWFCFGALASALAARAGLGVIEQAVVFIVISIALLILTKPFIKKIIKPKKEATNADRIINQKAIVMEDIDNLSGKGMIKADGKEWSARNLVEDEIIIKGTEVIVVEIKGVRAIIKKL